MAIVPFLTYKILPSQTIVRENIRLEHIKEDIEALIHALSPILFITKTGVPKPSSLGSGVIQPLADKHGTLSLLRLLGWLPNKRGDYVFVNADSSQEVTQRETVTNEFQQFFNELKKMKDHEIGAVEDAFAIITTVPFSTYRIVPADRIIRDNVRLGQIKQDLEALMYALTPVLYVTKTGVPKPPFLDPTIIQQLTDKPGTLSLLPLFGCVPNNRGEYIFNDGKTAEDAASREAAATEFRQFYEEMKKAKNGSIDAMEYFLNHPTADTSLTPSSV